MKLGKKAQLMPVLWGAFKDPESAGVVGTAPNAADCVAYYKFENNGTDATGTNNATVTGATYGTGVLNNGIILDGINDWVNTNITDIGTTFSISFFVKFDDVSTYQAVISKWTGPNTNRWVFDMGTSPGTLRFFVAGTFAEETGLTTGTWYHVGGVYDGSNVKIYVDAVETVTGSANTFINTSVDIVLGRYTGAGSYFEGALDEVSFYNTALTASNMEYLYQDGNPGTAQQYPFT